MDPLLPFLSEFSARKVELLLAMAAWDALVFTRGTTRVLLSEVVARELACVGHTQLDPFRRGARVQLQLGDKAYESTQGQLNLMRLLSSTPSADFLRTCGERVAAHGRQRRLTRTTERKRRRDTGQACHRIHIERKAAYGFPVAAFMPSGGIPLCVDS